MTLTSRPYGNTGDRQLIHELLRSAAGRSSTPAYGTVGDFEWWLVNDDDPTALRSSTLWFDGDARLVAFTWPNAPYFDLFVHPSRRDLDALLLHDWVTRQPAEAGELTVHCLDSDTARIEALNANGFAATGRGFDDWVQPLDSLPDDATPVPEGYVIRSFAGEIEIESRVAAHRSAFHPSRMTVEKHARALASPLYRQDLDLVAVAPDGQIASYTLVWFDEVNGKGLFEPVGTHADHRRLGLSRCVIHEGLRRLKALGAAYAFVNSTAGDVPSNRLYASCGFRIVDGVTIWKRP